MAAGSSQNESSKTSKKVPDIIDYPLGPSLEAEFHLAVVTQAFDCLLFLRILSDLLCGSDEAVQYKKGFKNNPLKSVKEHNLIPGVNHSNKL